MTACAWCLNTAHSQTCIAPGSDQCRTERQLEDLAYALNKSKIDTK